MPVENPELNSPKDLSDWTWTIGIAVAPFSRFGEIKVNIETDFPERFSRLREVCLRPPKGAPKLFTVERARPHKGQMLLKLGGIEKIEDIDPWRGALVQIPRREAMPLGKDEYYRQDLVGLEVVTTEGRVLGRLEEVLAYPAQDLYRIGDILIPAVKQIVVKVDIAGGRLLVDPPAGMIPEEEPDDQN